METDAGAMKLSAGGGLASSQQAMTRLVELALRDTTEAPQGKVYRRA